MLLIDMVRAMEVFELTRELEDETKRTLRLMFVSYLTLSYAKPSMKLAAVMFQR